MYRRSTFTSRREFVKDFALTSGALAFGVSFVPTASAANPAPADHAVKLNSDVAPATHEACGVIVKSYGATYLVFKATQTNDDDDQVEGTAVIELIGCCATAIIHPASDVTLQPGRPRYFGELDNAAIYEVENSSWLAAVNTKCRQMLPIEKHTTRVPLKSVSRSGKVTFTSKPMTVTVSNPAYSKPDEAARHFAITFRCTTFHCVADELKADFLQQPFGYVLSSLLI